jgi:hypothetical protein
MAWEEEEEDLIPLWDTTIAVCLCVSFPTDGIGRRFDPFREFSVLKFSGLQQNLHCDAAQLKF